VKSTDYVTSYYVYMHIVMNAEAHSNDVANLKQLQNTVCKAGGIL